MVFQGFHRHVVPSGYKLLLTLAVFGLHIVQICSPVPGKYSFFVHAGSALLIWIACSIKDLFENAKIVASSELRREGRKIGFALSLGALCECIPGFLKHHSGSFKIHWVTPIFVSWILPFIDTHQSKYKTESGQYDSTFWKHMGLATVFPISMLCGLEPIEYSFIAIDFAAAVCISWALARLYRITLVPHNEILHVEVRFEKQLDEVEELDEDEYNLRARRAYYVFKHVASTVTLCSVIYTCALGQPLLSGLVMDPQLPSCVAYAAIGACQLWFLFKIIILSRPRDLSLLFFRATNLAVFLTTKRFDLLAELLFSLLNTILTNSKISKESQIVRTVGCFRIQVLFISVFLLGKVFLTKVSCGHLVDEVTAVDPTTLYGDHPLLESSNRSSSHPIEELASSAEKRAHDLLKSQSRSLREAGMEYKRRYGIPPPPNFDKWYDYARRRNVLIYDDYDIINEAILPFWGLSPITIRTRVQEAIGHSENFLMALKIRNGKVALLQGGLPWQQEALRGLVEDFVEDLPDLDLAFNAHDEPRVVVPHDQLTLILEKAQNVRATLEARDTYYSIFSDRPADITTGDRMKEFKDSRFNEYPHQSSSGPSRLSCPPNSPARAIEDLETFDSTAAYCQDCHLSFIANHTAYTDVCYTPSFKGTHAFFDRPNAFNVAHELIPIFSESKLSSFQDIPYPSLWHWYGKIFVNTTEDMHLKHKLTYDSTLDVDWRQKKDDLYWRGSTTGGFSRSGGWRRHHRQRIVHYLNGRDNATVLVPPSADASRRLNTSNHSWAPQKIGIRHLAPHLNVTFSGVGQCTPSDCDTQKEFFSIKPYANISDAYQHRYLLDLDGNAFSARFYGLMQSKSLVFKQAIFREWHDEWLMPWAHYIPLSLNTGRNGGRGWEQPSAAIGNDKYLESEWAEALRYFVDEDARAEVASETGIGEHLATTKRRWANMMLRREDMQSWMFRLLLEYARVVDDRRDTLGSVR